MLAPEDDSRALDALRFSLAGDIVELVVLTTDDAFLKTLRDAGDPTRRLWHVLSPEEFKPVTYASALAVRTIAHESLICLRAGGPAPVASKITTDALPCATAPLRSRWRRDHSSGYSRSRANF